MKKYKKNIRSIVVLVIVFSDKKNLCLGYIFEPYSQRHKFAEISAIPTCLYSLDEFKLFRVVYRTA